MISVLQQVSHDYLIQHIQAKYTYLYINKHEINNHTHTITQNVTQKAAVYNIHTVKIKTHKLMLAEIM